MGDASTDFNFYSKRAILSGVLSATFARWLGDDSDDEAATKAFLAARIDNVMQFEKLKARVRSFRNARSAQSRDARQMFSTSLGARNSTGNSAFDDYRSATLTKLEQEAADFRTYLNELRHAKDKSEFDAFLNERRGKPADETLSP